MTPLLFFYMTDDLVLHPACDAYPMMSETELTTLAEDIKLNGLIDPITRMPDGSILDGKNREEACRRVGVEARYETYTGDDPIRFVIAKNERRRHSSHAERAFIAATLANLAKGINRIFSGKDPVSQPEAAKLMNVSLAAVGDARAVQTYAADNVVNMVRSGKVGLQTAAHAARSVRDKTKQATWTEGDVIRIGNAAKTRSARIPQTERKAKAPYRNPYYTNHSTGLIEKMRLTPEQSGRPSPELGRQQHPDWPTGWTYGMVHVEQHGRVQVVSIEQKAKQALFARFNDLAIAIVRLAEDLPDPAEIDKFSDARADKLVGMFDRNLEKAQQNLADFVERYRARAK